MAAGSLVAVNTLSDDDISKSLMELGTDEDNSLKANDVLKILKEKIAFLSGGRDRSGRAIITFLARVTFVDIESERLIKLINYLASIPCQEVKVKGLTVIVDGRSVDWRGLKPLLNILEEAFLDTIAKVFVIKSDSFWKRGKAMITQMKTELNMQVVSISNLVKQIDITDLTEELQGILPYCHEEWIELRLMLEEFSRKSLGVIHQMDKISDSVGNLNLPKELEAIKERKKDHLKIKQLMHNLPINEFEENGQTILDLIQGERPIRTSLEDFTASASRIQTLINIMHTKRQQLRDQWQKQKLNLDQHYQLCLFVKESGKVREWIKRNRDNFLMKLTDIGTSIESAKRHKEDYHRFQESAMNVYVNVSKLLQQGNKLFPNMQYAKEDLLEECETLDREWKHFAASLEERGALVRESLLFHKEYENFIRLVDKLKRACHHDRERIPQGLSTLQDLQLKHNTIQEEFKEAYNKIKRIGKDLSQLLHTPSTIVINSNMWTAASPTYNEAANHVLSLLHTVEIEKEEFERKWSSVVKKLDQKYQLCIIDEDSDRVIEWIELHGEMYLIKNFRIAKSLSKADMLLRKHEEFEKMCETMYNNAEKLLKTCEHLTETAECDKRAVQNLRKRLFDTVENFRKCVCKRREMIELSIVFHSHTKEFTKWLNGVKMKLCQDAFASSLAEAKEMLEGCQVRQKAALNAQRLTKGDCDNLIRSLKDHYESFAALKNKNKPSEELLNEAVDLVEEVIAGLSEKRRAVDGLWAMRLSKLELCLDFFELKENIDKFMQDCDQQRSEILDATYPDSSQQMEMLINAYEDKNTLFTSQLEELQLLRDNIVPQIQDLQINIPSSSDENEQDHVSALNASMQLCVDKQQQFVNTNSTKLAFMKRHLTLVKFIEKGNELSGWIRHAELSLINFSEIGRNPIEAKSLQEQFEGFKKTIDCIGQSVENIYKEGTKLNESGLHNFETCNNCINNIMESWDCLNRLCNLRDELLTTSVQFHEASEEIFQVLSSAERDFSSGRDPCDIASEFTGVTNKSEAIYELIAKHNKERDTIIAACGLVRVYSTNLLSLIQAIDTYANEEAINETSKDDIVTSSSREHPRLIIEQLRRREGYVLNLWRSHMISLEHCKEFIIFDTEAKKTLNTLHESNIFHIPMNLNYEKLTESEAKLHLKLFRENEASLKEMYRTIENLLEDGVELIENKHNHADNVKAMMDSLETNYYDCDYNMSKHQFLLEAITKGEPTTEYPDKHTYLHKMSSRASLSSLRSDLQRSGSRGSLKRQLSEDDEKQRIERRKKFVINELITTEQTYVKDLEQVINIYMEAMHGPDVPAELYGRDEVIFGNIEEIYNFHKSTFCNELTACIDSPENVGNCFISHAEHFEMYVDYCRNKSRSNTVVMEYGQTFFDDVQQRSCCDVSLSSYLIKPVQRMTKYQLLLKDLMDCVDSGKEEIKASVEVMLSVPRRANDAMHAGLLTGVDSDIEGLGKVIMQDECLLMDSKSIRRKEKERHLFLFEKALVLSKQVKDGDGNVKNYIFKSRIMVADIASVGRIENEPLKFVIISKRASDSKLIFKSYSESVTEEWIKRLKPLVYIGIAKLRGNVSIQSRPGSGSEVFVSPEDSDGDYPRLSGIGSEKDYSSGEELLLGSIAEPQERKTKWRKKSTKSRFSQQHSSDDSIPRSYGLKRSSTLPEFIKDPDVDTESTSSSFEINQYYYTEPSKGKFNRSNSTKAILRSTNKFAKSLIKKSSSNKNTKAGISPPFDESVTHQNLLRKHSAPEVAGFVKLPSSRSQKDFDTLESEFWAEDMEKVLTESKKFSTPPQNDIQTSLLTSSSNYYESSMDSHAIENNYTKQMKSDVQAVRNRSLDKNILPISPVTIKAEGYSNVDGQKGKRLLQEEIQIIQELIKCEELYVRDLEYMINGYMTLIEDGNNYDWQVPETLKQNKQSIFRNIEKIRNWHKNVFCKSLKSCLERPEKLGSVFLKFDSQRLNYVEYCFNIPKSQILVNEYNDFFEKCEKMLNLPSSLQDYVIRPVEQLRLYQSWLNRLLTYVGASLNAIDVKAALHLVESIIVQVEYMSEVGKLEGYDGNILRLGKLLLHDYLTVYEGKAIKKGKERYVFLFEQAMILADTITNKRRKSETLKYIYKNHIKMNHVRLEEQNTEDLTRWSMWETGLNNNRDDCYHFQARSVNVKNTWLDRIRFIMDNQRSFADALSSPIDYQSKQKSLSSSSLPSSMECFIDDPLELGIRRSHHAYSLQRMNDLDNARKLSKDKFRSPGLIQKFFRLSQATQRSGSDPVLPLSTALPSLKIDHPADDLSQKKSDPTSSFPHIDALMLNKGKRKNSIHGYDMPDVHTPLVDQEVLSSTSAMFTCVIQAMDRPAITWFLNGNQLLQSNYNIQIDSYNNEHQLRIQSVSQGDIGQYTCHAKNFSGEVSTTALLKLRDDNYDNIINWSWKEYFYNSYNLYDEIGKGKFADVKHCTHRETLKEFAVKIYQKDIISKAGVQRELDIWQPLQHAKICSFHEVYDCEDIYMIVMEYLPGGRLFDYLCDNDCINELQIQNYMKQIGDGLRFLHQMSVVKVNLKPENIILEGCEHKFIKLVGFSHAICLDDCHMIDFDGDVEFAAPEVISQSGISSMSDMCLTGLSPFYKKKKKDTCKMIVSGSYDSTFLKDMSDDCRNFIKHCLAIDPW
ncbi:uncharacterized protein TRIADDRAFT_54394 [Trichoplax adhaerens]|uniref:non-specific serine/threonine protein kinase n=1 Tax=Trichoplax adhaerens TaxID=10228 RepID=B3RRW8_TRIAD|nr:hypothetical protein TRIADDRAFT_54394 [Trichoplax adhaerens]EDV26943.1 hypothetical protein TRIADDRAFT_54394 [Trichoplax adhaerens]|eukprot:XP_002110939.1 hypothetical protein TRIADDRAFT_54394 [Trichoplax adhaerens]